MGHCSAKVVINTSEASIRRSRASNAVESFIDFRFRSMVPCPGIGKLLYNRMGMAKDTTLLDGCLLKGVTIASKQCPRFTNNQATTLTF